MIKENSFLLCVGHVEDFRALEGASLKVSRRDLVLFENIQNEAHLQVVEDEFDVTIYVGTELHTDPGYARGLLRTEWDHRKNNGGLIRFRAREQSIAIHSDFLGTEIIYYRTIGSAILISNRIENLASLRRTSPDYAAVYQFLSGSFSVGSRTLLQEVYQNRPSSTIEYSARTGLVREVLHDSWYKGTSADAAEHRDFVVGRWRAVLATLPSYIVMLSAGWDSRLLLVGPNVSSTYTHGDLGSREVKLAFQIGAQRSLPMTYNPLVSCDYSAGRLAEMVERLGHAFFPHWYHAAEYCAQTSTHLLTAGLYAELVSGHYGIHSLSSGMRKLKNLSKSMLAAEMLDQMSDSEAIDLLVPLLSAGPSSKQWYMGEDWAEYFADVRQTFESDVRAVLEGYVAHRTTGAQEICERFRLEHSDRQYFVNQTRCALPFNGFYHPYADSELSQSTIRIPYRDRVNYKLSQWIVSHTDASLLEYPLAATLVKAKRPILVQEASRLARIGLEQLNVKSAANRHMRLGWNNFQFLLAGSAFHDYVDSLRCPIWHKQGMHEFVRRHTAIGGSAYSLLDMFGKILTIDHRITTN